jgi:hypothetical protein
VSRDGLRVREVSGEEGNRLLRIVRRSSGSVVTWRRAQMVLLSVQGMDVAAGEPVGGVTAEGDSSLGRVDPRTGLLPGVVVPQSCVGVGLVHEAADGEPLAIRPAEFVIERHPELLDQGGCVQRVAQGEAVKPSDGGGSEGGAVDPLGERDELRLGQTVDLHSAPDVVDEAEEAVRECTEAFLPSEDHAQHLVGSQPPQGEGEGVQGPSIRPLGVVDDHDQPVVTSGLAELVEEPGPDGEGVLATTLVERGPGILRRRVARHRAPPAELATHLIDQTEGQPDLVLFAVDRHNGRLTHQRTHERCLADPRRPGDEQQSRLPAHRFRECATAVLELPLPPDQRTLLPQGPVERHGTTLGKGQCTGARRAALYRVFRSGPPIEERSH